MMKKVVLLGSMRYYYKMSEIERCLILEGFLPLLPTPAFRFDEKGEVGTSFTDTSINVEDLKKKLAELHRSKIMLADIVLVCNFDNYIGESTFAELCYAYHLMDMDIDKKLYFLEDNTGKLHKEYIGNLPVYEYNGDLRKELGL